MKFVNRKKEMERLKRLTEHSQASLAVIWGRRRIGKTRLLLEWAHKFKGIYYTADESSPTLQRRYLSLAIEQALPGFADVEYPDWTALFNRLARDSIHAQWRGPIIIDELPYLISESPELPSVLQRFIDHEAKQAKLIMALCGSSQRMMQGAILDASAPLYGRANELMKLTPISAGYLGEALDLQQPREIIESYSVWGGIPRYWELVENSKGSFLDIITSLVLDPMGALSDEPNHLLLEELPSAISLRPILDAIGLGAHRMSEIAARIGQPSTSIVRHLQRLIELDLVERETPFGVLEHSSKRALYKLKDPFIRFWFEVVASRRSFFAQTTARSRRQILESLLPPIISQTWEDLCRQAVPFFGRDLNKIPFGQAKRFWHKQDAEWDIVAETLGGETLLIGEAKWFKKASRPLSSWIHREIEALKKKGLPLDHKPKKIVYVLFIPEKTEKLMLPDNVKVFDAKDVLSALRNVDID